MAILNKQVMQLNTETKDSITKKLNFKYQIRRYKHIVIIKIKLTNYVPITIEINNLKNTTKQYILKIDHITEIKFCIQASHITKAETIIGKK